MLSSLSSQVSLLCSGLRCFQPAVPSIYGPIRSDCNYWRLKLTFSSWDDLMRCSLAQPGAAVCYSEVFSPSAVLGVSCVPLLCTVYSLTTITTTARLYDSNPAWGRPHYEGESTDWPPRCNEEAEPGFYLRDTRYSFYHAARHG